MGRPKVGKSRWQRDGLCGGAKCRRKLRLHRKKRPLLSHGPQLDRSCPAFPADAALCSCAETLRWQFFTTSTRTLFKEDLTTAAVHVCVCSAQSNLGHYSHGGALRQSPTQDAALRHLPTELLSGVRLRLPQLAKGKQPP